MLPGQMSTPTSRARELFLYGDGDGEPITNVSKLSKKSGVSSITLYKWIPDWEKERREQLAQSSSWAGSLIYAEDALKKNNEDLIYFRTRIEELKKEERALDKTNGLLLDTVDQILAREDFDPANADRLLSLLDKHFRTSAHRTNITKEIVMLHGHWTAKGGVDAVMSARKTSAETAVKLKAKMDFEEKRKELGTDPASVAANRGAIIPARQSVFGRAAQVEAEEIDESQD